MEASSSASKRRRGMSPPVLVPEELGTASSPTPAVPTSPSLVERLRASVRRRRESLQDAQQVQRYISSAARASPPRTQLFHAQLRAEHGGACGHCSVPWDPPASPWGLLEEMLYNDPWRLLVACILLNRTTGQQVRGVLGPLWRAYPTPQAMAAADEADLRAILRPLGLHNTRAVKLKRFSHDFITKQWKSPTELHGVGCYAADAYTIFHLGHWRDAKPADKDLKSYVKWLEATGGEGAGLEREDLEQLLQAPHLPGQVTDGAAATAEGLPHQCTEAEAKKAAAKAKGED